MQVESLSRWATIIEPLGDKMNVHLSTAKHRGVVAQVDAEPGLGLGTVIPIRFDLGQVHFFDGDANGARL